MELGNDERLKFDKGKKGINDSPFFFVLPSKLPFLVRIKFVQHGNMICINTRNERSQ